MVIKCVFKINLNLFIFLIYTTSMVFYIISLLGQYIGYLLASKTKEELKQGEKYFKLICLILLLIIGFYSLILSFDIILLIIGLILGFLIRKEYLYFGLISNNVFLASLIFIFGLPYGTLKYKMLKELNLNVALFVFSFAIGYFFNLYSLAGGALFGILIKKVLYNLVLR